MESTSTDTATSKTKLTPPAAAGTLQYLNPDYMPQSLDSNNSPLAMLARTCNSIGKDSIPSKPVHHSHQQQLQSAGADKKDGSSRLIKSTSPGKKSSTATDMTSRKDHQSSTSSSTLSRQSAAAGGKGRSSSSPVSSRPRQCREAGTSARRGDVGTASRWAAVNDNGLGANGAGSPSSTSRTADSDRDSVDELRCVTGAGHSGRHQQSRQSFSPFGSNSQSSVGLYDSLRLQQEVAALQAAIYSPLHQLLAQRQMADPLAMYSASLQAAAVIAATQANLTTGRLPNKDSLYHSYQSDDFFQPSGVETAASGDLVGNSAADSSLFGAAAAAAAAEILPLRPTVPPVGPLQQPFTCSWLTAGGEFCAQRFSSSDELLAHLRTHVVQGGAAGEDTARSPLAHAAVGSAFAPTVAGILGGQSATLPIPGPFGTGGAVASLAAAHAAASFYRNKLQRPLAGRSSHESTSPSSTAGAGSLFYQSAASSSRYHPYKWTPSPYAQLSSAVAAANGLSGTDLGLAAPPPPALTAFLPQSPYGGLFSAQTLGATVP